MTEDVTSTSTADHSGPLQPAHSAATAALQVAFPRPLQLSIPTGGEAVGRRWLHACGIDDRKVSGAHLQFQRGKRLRITDRGSRNGTFINGQRLARDQPQALVNGDVLRLGRTLMVYCADGHHSETRAAIGELVAPFGLAALRNALAAMALNPPLNVLIEGETGTGKELAARAVAKQLDCDKPYSVVNMASVPAGVFEAQLFGHTAGAFSDAKTASAGLVAAHQGGALCLDELGELPLAMQPKLLRLLENREIQPVGSACIQKVKVLLIATTNRDLRQLAQSGAFRLDLVARLARTRLVLPPLRQRRADIFYIAQQLADGWLVADHVEVEAAERLLLQDWPTNARGVAAVLAEVHALDPEAGLRAWALERVLSTHPEASAQSHGQTNYEPPAASQALTEKAVRQALAACAGNETRAAKALGVSRGKLRRFLAKQS